MKTTNGTDDTNSRDDDPFLSLNWIRKDLDVSKATFYRVHRPKLRVTIISPRRRAVRRSIYQAYKAALPCA